MGVYCDHDDVTGFLQSSDAFSATSTPAAADVERIIQSIEDEIDDATKHAWRVRRQVSEYGKMRWDNRFRISRPAAFVELEHWSIRTLARANFDKLEVFTGTSYIDWLDPAENRVEARNGDYFLVARTGRIYLLRGIPFRDYSYGVRTTYRYGDVDVWGSVHKLAVRMAALELMNLGHDDYIAGGGLNPQEGQPVSQAIDKLQKEVDKKLANTDWVRVPRRKWRLSGGPY